MKIEKGKQYKTRMGEVATVYDIVENGQTYPVLGSIQSKNNSVVDLASWTLDGKFFIDFHDGENDLIEEL